MIPAIDMSAAKKQHLSLVQPDSLGDVIADALVDNVRKQDIIRVVQMLVKVKQEKRTLIVQPRYDGSNSGLWIALTEKPE